LKHLKRGTTLRTRHSNCCVWLRRRPGQIQEAGDGKDCCSLSGSRDITSDNPRTEDAGDISKEIEEGVLNEGQPRLGYEIIVDRASAIERAILSAEEGDVLVIAGKGHETYQIFHDATIHFDDREVAASLLKERMKNA